MLPHHPTLPGDVPGLVRQLTGLWRLLADRVNALWAWYVRPANALAIVSGAVTLNCAQGDYYTLTLTQSATLAIANPPSGAQSIAVRVSQNGTGGYTLTLPASFKATGGSDTAVAAAANATTLLCATTFDGGTRWEYTMQDCAP